MGFNKKEIITEIKHNNEAVLSVLSKKYFSSCRRILRRRGVKDSETPEVFAQVLAHVYLTIQQHVMPDNIDFEDYFFLTLHEWVDKLRQANKAKSKVKFTDLMNDRNKIASDCVSILDEQSRQLIYARVVEKLSYEKMAGRFRFTNAVMAQQEFNKAFNQLEGIVKLRMNISLN